MNRERISVELVIMVRHLYFPYLEHVLKEMKLGTDIHKENSNGETPIFYARFSGNLTLVKYLIELGSAINKENMNGETPLSLAFQSRNQTLIQHLTDLNAV